MWNRFFKNKVTENLNTLQKTALGLAVLTIIFITPFSINVIFKGDIFQSIFTIAVLAAMGYNSWSISIHGRYNYFVTALIYVPAVLLLISFLIQTQGTIGVLWCYPSIIAFYFMLPKQKAYFINVISLALLLPQIIITFERPIAIRMSVTVLMTSICSAILIKIIAEQQDKLEKQATTDPLTGVLNRTLLHDSLEEAIKLNRRENLPMTLVSIDIDNFKEINDTFGHESGDTVLQGIGGFLQKRLRSLDKVFRMGGEEFLILLHSTELESGIEVAEELRNSIAELTLLPKHPVTASIGVAKLKSDETWKDWIKRSDKNLYKAKLGGKNLVVSH